MLEMRRVETGNGKIVWDEFLIRFETQQSCDTEVTMETEWMIIGIFMAICTVTDIRKKEIPVTVIILSGLALLCYMIFAGRKEWTDILYSLIPGMFLLMLSYCTRECIGYGDGLVVLVMGICMGLGICMAAVAVGLTISAICVGALLAFRKVGGKSRIPFVPFLSAGLGVVFIAQNGI